MRSIHLKQSGIQKRGGLSVTTTRWWKQLVGAVVSLNESSHVAAIADNRLLTMWSKVAVAIGTPIIVGMLGWTGSLLIHLDERVGKLENTMSLTLPDLYPRGEAVNNFGRVDARIDGVMEDVRSNTHRISALEDVRRLH